MRSLTYAAIFAVGVWIGLATAVRPPPIVYRTFEQPLNYPVSETFGCTAVYQSCKARERASRTRAMNLTEGKQ